MASWIVIFFLFLLLLLLLIAVVYYFTSTPPSPQPPPVRCSRDQILEAYVRDDPVPPGCPDWRNNLVVSNGRLYEKDFVVVNGTRVTPNGTNNQCCVYSNKETERIPLDNPYICLGIEGKILTDQELNEKPYAFNNNRTIFLTPQCQTPGGSFTNNCIALIRFGIDKAGNGLYKAYIYAGSGSNNAIASDVNNIVFTIADQCSQLLRIDIGDIQVVGIVNGKPTFLINSSTLPSLVVTVTKFFLTRGFQPIAAANPILADLAARS